MQNRTITALLLAGASAAVSAADYELDPVIVTASRVAETADDSLNAVSIVTREDIERLQPQSVTDVLRLQPGIDVVRAGGTAGSVSVFMRGTESDHALVLVDGVRASSGTTGQFEWRSLDPAQIERIEIVRGPRASLYGSDAIGGVIQIFTRRPSGITAQVEAGSHNTRRASVGYGGEAGALRYDFSVAGERSDGINSRAETSSQHEPDDDGVEGRSVSGRLRYQLNQDTEISLSGWHGDKEIEFDDGPTPPNADIDLENSSVTASLRQSLNERWLHSLQFGYARDEQVTRSRFPSTITTRRHSADWQHEYVLTDEQMLIGGVSWFEDKVENINDGTGATDIDERRGNRAGYLSWMGDFGAQDWALSLRHDDYDQFGGATTGSIAWGYDVNAAWRVTASYGTAFKAPSFNELYYPFYGNTELGPEESATAEMGLRWRPSTNHSFKAQLFQTNVDDLIGYDRTTFSANNIDEARIRGLELIYAGSAGPWHWRANATLQRARDLSDDSRLARRPDEKLALVIGRDVGAGHVQTDVVLVGDREDSHELHSYGLFNLSASYPIGHGLDLTGRIENLTDKDYELAADYQTLGRSYYVGLRYTPGAD